MKSCRCLLSAPLNEGAGYGGDAGLSIPATGAGYRHPFLGAGARAGADSTIPATQVPVTGTQKGEGVGAGAGYRGLQE